MAGLVGSFLTCTRCRQPCAPGSKCRVPHPMHLRQELGMMSGPEGMRASYGCKACGQQYAIVTPWTRGPDGLAAGEPKYEGPEWCYAGLHSSKELPCSDLRRVYPATVCGLHTRAGGGAPRAETPDAPSRARPRRHRVRRLARARAGRATCHFYTPPGRGRAACEQ